MDIKISNFKHIGLNILQLFILLAVVDSNITGPQREVVSIYNDDFTTPASKPPYFIEVYRCVTIEQCEAGRYGHPVPNKTEKIEIVVSDITNKDRDPSNKKKFYRYVVYNHTSCECGSLKYRNSKLYKTKTNNKVSEVYFKAKYSNNPTNLIRVCNICDSSQPRYKLHTKLDALPQFKFLAYQQCLPGCVVVKKSTFNETTTLAYKKKELVPLTNDILCQAYDGAKIQLQVNLQSSP